MTTHTPGPWVTVDEMKAALKEAYTAGQQAERERWRQHITHDSFCNRRRWQGSRKRALDPPGTNTMELTADACSCGVDDALQA